MSSAYLLAAFSTSFSSDLIFFLCESMSVLRDLIVSIEVTAASSSENTNKYSTKYRIAWNSYPHVAEWQNVPNPRIKGIQLNSFDYLVFANFFVLLEPF